MERWEQTVERLTPPLEPAEANVELIMQEKSIQLLMTGLGDQSVADELDIARQTVCNWRHNDAAFAAGFNAERQALWSTHRERLRSLVAQAVDVLAEDMAATLESKLRQSAAIDVLKAVCLYGQKHGVSEHYFPTGAREPI